MVMEEGYEGHIYYCPDEPTNRILAEESSQRTLSESDLSRAEERLRAEEERLRAIEEARFSGDAAIAGETTI